MRITVELEIVSIQSSAPLEGPQGLLASTGSIKGQPRFIYAGPAPEAVRRRARQLGSPPPGTSMPGESAGLTT